MYAKQCHDLIIKKGKRLVYEYGRLTTYLYEIGPYIIELNVDEGDPNIDEDDRVRSSILRLFTNEPSHGYRVIYEIRGKHPMNVCIDFVSLVNSFKEFSDYWDSRGSRK